MDGRPSSVVVVISPEISNVPTVTVLPPAITIAAGCGYHPPAAIIPTA